MSLLSCNTCDICVASFLCGLSCDDVDLQTYEKFCYICDICMASHSCGLSCDGPKNNA